MDRFPKLTKTITITAALMLAACGGGDSQPKKEHVPEFPASQTRESNNLHTAVDPMPAQPSVAEEIPSIVEEKVAEPLPEPVKFSGFMRQRASMRLRRTPVLEQGTSNRMPSKWLCHFSGAG